MSNRLRVLAFAAVNMAADTLEEQPEILAWLARCGWGESTALALAGDVSTRRYFRLARESIHDTAILALYPQSLLPACARFLQTSSLLSQAAVPVPEVLASDCEQGYMLVSDVGERTLYDWAERPWHDIRPYFERALSLTESLACLPIKEVGSLLPPLAHEALLRELRQTWDVLLRPSGLVGSSEEMQRWWRALDELCFQLGQLQSVPCHRDFMVRNLVPRVWTPIDLWVLDHQDLRLGPPHYDLASLLNDSLFPPGDWVQGVLDARLKSAAEWRAYHQVAAQRTLKAVGTYMAFAQRGMKRHLPLVRPTLERALSHLQHLAQDLPSLSAFRERLASTSFC